MKSTRFLGPVVTRVVAVLAAWMVLGAGAAAAGEITRNEAKLDTIFSQAGFTTGGDNKSIDIRFNPDETVFNTALLSIDSDGEFNSLAALSVFSDSPTVNMFFVDAITFCGSAGINIVGCGSIPGNLIALDSDFAKGANGGNLAAHELGHNLALSHLLPDNGSNLMNPSITANSVFTAAQITTILASGLVQMDGTQRFISITPIAVVASVPEPRTWVMLGLGLVGVAGWVRRRQRCAA